MKSLLFLSFLFSFLITLQLSAQPVILRQAGEGSFAYDFLTAGIIRTSDGGFLSGGTIDPHYTFPPPMLPSGDDTGTNHGGQDYWIVKHDANGHIQWNKTYGGSNDDYLTVIKQTIDGGYILGGYSTSGISGDKTDSVRGFLSNSPDYWIVKIDSLGNIQWDKTYGGTSIDNLSCLQQTKDGGYVLGGSSYSNMSDEKTENSFGNGYPDYWIVKIDSLGNKQWDKTYGGNNYDNCFEILQTTEGGFLIGGSSASGKSGNKSQNGHGQTDMWIIKTDSIGNMIWNKAIGGNKDDRLNSFDLTNDGGFILGSTSDSHISGNKTENSRGFSDYWVIKMDRAGNIQWQKTMGGDMSDYLETVRQTKDGGYIVEGDILQSRNGDISERPYGGYDLWIVKLTSDGHIKWDKLYGGDNEDLCYDNSVLEVKRDVYLIAGYSASGVSGNKTVPTKTSPYDFDFWYILVKDTATPSIAQAGKFSLIQAMNGKGSFVVYPNPAKDIVHIQVNGAATISIIDVAGKLMNKKYISGTGEMNVAKLPAGIYYLKNNTTGETQKLEITK